jgi:hypothetical protein
MITATPNNVPTSTAWFDQPMRWAQLTLTEKDPQIYDAAFWLDYFKAARCDAACLSAAGCVAYYPTTIPFHYKTPYLGGRDCFGELYRGCRELGMIVIARTDPHAIHADAFQAHPEWVMVTADGEPRKHWADPDLWVTCALGPYNFDFMTSVHQELMRMYPVDGIFSNRWSGHGICYCESCRRNFREARGFEIPGSIDPNEPAYRAYIDWRQERLFQVWDCWDAAIREINPRACFIPNTGGGALSDLDMSRIGERAPILFADRQGRSGLEAVWSNGKNGKEYRATLGSKPIAGIFNMGIEAPYRWKDSVQSDAEIQLFVADGVANGLRPWFTKFSGMIYDQRWLETVKTLYNRYAGWEKYLRNLAPIAEVGLVYSQRTSDYYGGLEGERKVEDPIRGWYHAMIEARIPFEMVHDANFAKPETRAFKTLILPNIACLSDDQCLQIRDYVAGGGSVIATGETSLYDEWGNHRADFGMADLFGVHFTGFEPRMQNSYLSINADPEIGKYHPILKGLENAGRIINGVSRVALTPESNDQDAPLTLIPTYPDLPMEMIWVRQPKTDIPGVFIRKFGKGKIIYFPWDIDRTFWEVLCVDHGKLLRNAVKYCTGDHPLLIVDGPGILDVTVWKQKDSLTIHLVNLTNPMMMKGPIRELIPVGQQVVRVRLPDGRKVTRVQLLNAGLPRPLEFDGEYLTIIVPSILDHEIVAVDLADYPTGG